MLNNNQIYLLNQAIFHVRQSQLECAVTEPKLYALHNDVLSYIDDIMQDYPPSATNKE